MPNEFVISNGFISKDSSRINGTLTATTVTASTITGTTIRSTTLVSNTISATTYQNLPTDIRVTGATYNNNTFTYTNNTGGTFNVSFNTMTGLTINGNLSASTGSSSIDLQPNKLDLTFSSDTKILIDGNSGNTIQSIQIVGEGSVKLTGGTKGNTTVFTLEPSVISGSTDKNIILYVDNGLDPIKKFSILETRYNLTNVPAYNDDSDAGTNGLTEGDIYQTTGAGVSPLNVPGILMIKQP